MTKSAFISQLDDHYAEARRLATVAEQLIHQFIEEVGDMSFEYLYDEEDTEDADPDWCFMEDGYRLHSIYTKDYEIFIKQIDDYGCFRDICLDWLNPADRIEVAEFLCRR